MALRGSSPRRHFETESIMSATGSFLEKNTVRLHAAAAGSAGTAVNGTVFDSQGFESVVFLVSIATANAGNFLKVQQGDLADGSDMADLAGSAVVAAANGQVVVAEVCRPSKRYLRGQIVRAGANTATGDMYAIGCEAADSKAVVNNITNTLISEISVTPAQGTA